MSLCMRCNLYLAAAVKVLVQDGSLQALTGGHAVTSTVASFSSVYVLLALRGCTRHLPGDRLRLQLSSNTTCVIK
jgi:hypothetical protein